MGHKFFPIFSSDYQKAKLHNKIIQQELKQQMQKVGQFHSKECKEFQQEKGWWEALGSEMEGERKIAGFHSTVSTVFTTAAFKKKKKKKFDQSTRSLNSYYNLHVKFRNEPKTRNQGQNQRKSSRPYLHLRQK